MYKVNELLSVDLNLLPVLYVVLSEKHVTRSAEKLGMSQPKVSRALDKLRLFYRDELLVRGAGKYELTEAGQRILAHLRNSMPGLLSVVNAKIFNPLTSRRVFKVVMSPFGACLVSPALSDSLFSTKILVQSLAHDEKYLQDVIDARADMALYEYSPVQNLSAVSFSEVSLKCIISSKSKFRKKIFTLEEFLERKHIAFPMPGYEITFIDSILKEAGSQKRSYNIITPFVYGALRAVLEGDYVLTVPEPMAEYLSWRNPLRIVDPPGLIGKIKLSLMWNPAYDNDVGHAWLRELIQNIVRKELVRATSGEGVR
ncbi:MAG: LysR family transcriptional regulator [Desulfovibrio sp.]|uniref:LysR family transcriptional regulator n=1 Tax=Desulfovibrio sp. TaxID=885 RepID=UPI0039E3803F